MSDIEVKTERDRSFDISNGGKEQTVVRVRWRRPGQRRWRSFLLVPDEGQPLSELEENAELAAEAVAEGTPL